MLPCISKERTKSSQMGYPGTVLQFSCLFSVVYLFNYIEGGVNSTAILIAVFSIITLTLFIWNELHVKNPLLNLNIFKNKIFSAFDLSLHFNYICMYMIFFIMPFYLQKVLHLGPSFTGLVLTTSPLIMMILAPISGMLSDRFGSRSLSFYRINHICIGFIITHST